MKLYKLVVRDKNGKVMQIHERDESGFTLCILAETNKGYSVTITQLSN